MKALHQHTVVTDAMKEEILTSSVNCDIPALPSIKLLLFLLSHSFEHQHLS